MIHFISSYPERGFVHGKKTVGVASSTKNIILNLLKKNPLLKIKVFAEIFDYPEKYVENNVEIERIWKRNNLFSVIKTFWQIKPGSTLVVPIEFYMFGGILEMIVALKMMLLLKIRGVRIISIVHQVIENFDNLNESKISNFSKKIFVKIYYFLIKLTTNQIVVFEEYFKKIIGGSNVSFIPHAVEDRPQVNNIVSSDVKSTLLYFGFISPYKGIEDLIEKYDEKCGKLIIAGGPNLNHLKNKKYVDFVAKIFAESKNKGIKTTGFLQESEIPDYFENTEIVILPYRNFFSSSGPLSLALTYDKPFILSKPMAKYFDSHDFLDALKATGLTKDVFIFDFLDKTNSLESKITEISNNKEKILEFIKIVKEKRDWENITNQYYEILK